jgi:hypothetical protein
MIDFQSADIALSRLVTAISKIANHRSCHSPYSEEKGELNICRSRGDEALIKKPERTIADNAATLRAIIPQIQPNFRPLSPFPSLHQVCLIKPLLECFSRCLSARTATRFKANQRYSKQIKALWKKITRGVCDCRPTVQISGLNTITYYNLFAPMLTYCNHFDPLDFFGQVAPVDHSAVTDRLCSQCFVSFVSFCLVSVCISVHPWLRYESIFS